MSTSKQEQKQVNRLPKKTKDSTGFRPLSDLGAAIVCNYNSIIKKARLGHPTISHGDGTGETNLTAWDSSLSDRLVTFLKRIDEYREPTYYVTINRSTGFDVVVNEISPDGQTKRVDRDILTVLTLVAFETHASLFSNLYACYGKTSRLHDFVYDKNCAHKIVTIDFPVVEIIRVE